jgi:hypothetical protein|nr:MAG TPA: AAA domain protein [Caudoviricetes sp.]
MTDLQKEQIVQAIKDEVSRLGSQNKVATKSAVSPATISQMLNHNWELIKDELWQKVAQALDINTAEQWQVVETTNYRMVFSVLSDAKNASLFIPISHKAGSGKTTALTTFANLYSGNNVFYIQAREWARREFLFELCKVLGIKQDSGYTTVDTLGQKVILFFAQRTGKKPLLIVDEADKLKPSALRWFITLYNEMEDKMGVVISGTDNLEKTIKAGVKYNKLGFDELDDRFGRKFIHLIGATFKDFKAICESNGLKDRSLVASGTEKSKTLFERLFKECEPTVATIGGDSIKVVESFRRIKRVIKRELLVRE